MRNNFKNDSLLLVSLLFPEKCFWNENENCLFFRWTWTVLSNFYNLSTESFSFFFFPFLSPVSMIPFAVYILLPFRCLISKHGCFGDFSYKQNKPPGPWIKRRWQCLCSKQKSFLHNKTVCLLRSKWKPAEFENKYKLDKMMNEFSFYSFLM